MMSNARIDTGEVLRCRTSSYFSFSDYLFVVQQDQNAANTTHYGKLSTCAFLQIELAWVTACLW